MAEATSGKFDLLGGLLGGAQFGLGIAGAISGRKAAKKARKKQKQLIAKTLASFEDLSQRYTPSGQYGQRMLKGLETQKARDVGSGIQHALRSGIGGTTYADVSSRYEATTGRESRLRLEDYLSDKQADIEKEKARFLGSIDVKGPSSSDISSSISSAIGGFGTMLGAFGPKTPEAQTQTPETQTQTAGSIPEYLLRKRRITGLKPQSSDQAYNRLLSRMFTLTPGG